MLFNKRGIVNLSIYSFIILTLLLVLAFTYWFSNYYSENSNEMIHTQELSISLFSFRDSIIKLIGEKNSTYYYENIYDSTNIKFYLNNTVITGEYSDNNYLIRMNISSFGIKFCSNYTMNPVLKTKLFFNGSCIKIN